MTLASPQVLFELRAQVVLRLRKEGTCNEQVLLRELDVLHESERGLVRSTLHALERRGRLLNSLNGLLVLRSRSYPDITHFDEFVAIHDAALLPAEVSTGAPCAQRRAA